MEGMAVDGTKVGIKVEGKLEGEAVVGLTVGLIVKVGVNEGKWVDGSKVG
jgi:hypothetical protein